MGYEDACPESDQCHPLREPTSTLWKVLKVLFMVINVLASIGIFMLITFVIFVGIYGKDFTANDTPVFPDYYENYTEYLILYTSNIIASLIQVIIGFIGICRLNLKALYIYTGFILIDLVWQIASIILLKYSISIIIISLGYLTMMYFLIRELKRENGMI